MREYPVVKMWYTKHKGKTIEEIIDKDPSFACWMIKTFQNLTPTQAQYFKKRWGKELKKEYIQDVEPYEWKKGDPEQLYMELCETQDLQKALQRWRVPEDISLF